jgi:uncharacterized protein YrrD
MGLANVLSSLTLRETVLISCQISVLYTFDYNVVMVYKLPSRQTRRKSTQFSALCDKLISVAGLIGQDVINQEGEVVGRVDDLVFRWDTQKGYPPLSAIVARVARRNIYIKADKIARITPLRIELSTAKLDLREFKLRNGEVRLAEEVLDHQLIDVDGVRVVRASDLYIATVTGQIRLVGVDVSFRSIIRRIGPRRMRTRPTPELVIDWATIQSFGGQDTSRKNVKVAANRRELRKLRPGELADLLEDLGRDERQELLNALPKEQAADILEEMEPKEVETVLRESTKSEAGTFLSNMEPDEAADALRDIDENLRNELLDEMTDASANRVREVLSYNEETAGGFMNTSLYRADITEAVSKVKTMLLKSKIDLKEIESVVVEDDGKFEYDLAIVDLLIADHSDYMGNLIKLPETVTVPPDASINDVATLLVESRRSSILVVDEEHKALGRIFADDIVDALLPEDSHFHFPRLLS